MLAETPASDQAALTACNSTAPAVPTRLTYSTKVALTSLAAVVAAAKVARSKRSSPVDPPPTLSVGRPPKLLAGRVVLTWVSAASGASSAKADVPPRAPARPARVVANSGRVRRGL